MTINFVDKKSRAAFEKWYAFRAVHKDPSPIGSRDCGMQWAAWHAAWRKQAERLRVAELDVARMSWIESHPSYETQFDHEDGDLVVSIMRVTGYPNDREWTVYSKGHTVREAIDAAIAKEQTK